MIQDTIPKFLVQQVSLAEQSVLLKIISNLPLLSQSYTFLHLSESISLSLRNTVRLANQQTLFVTNCAERIVCLVIFVELLEKNEITSHSKKKGALFMLAHLLQGQLLALCLRLECITGTRRKKKHGLRVYIH